MYMGHRFFVKFLHKEVCSSLMENILQLNMFIIFCATEMIAQLRITFIIFIVVIVPMRWLAGKTHELCHCNWLERSMERAVDLMYNAFVEVKSDGELEMTVRVIQYEIMQTKASVNNLTTSLSEKILEATRIFPI